MGRGEYATIRCKSPASNIQKLGICLHFSGWRVREYGYELQRSGILNTGKKKNGNCWEVAGSFSVYMLLAIGKREFNAKITWVRKAGSIRKPCFFRPQVPEVAVKRK